MPLQHEAADFLCLDAGRSGSGLLPNGSDKAAPVVPQLVAEVARSSPEAVALQSGRSCLTYRELDARAGRLAGRLRSLGVGRDVPVGVRLERSFDQVARPSPAAVALQSGRSCLTYRELDARAGRLAGRLRSLGVGRDVPVGVRL